MNKDPCSNKCNVHIVNENKSNSLGMKYSLITHPDPGLSGTFPKDSLRVLKSGTCKGPSGNQLAIVIVLIPFPIFTWREEIIYYIPIKSLMGNSTGGLSGSLARCSPEQIMEHSRDLCRTLTRQKFSNLTHIYIELTLTG